MGTKPETQPPKPDWVSVQWPLVVVTAPKLAMDEVEVYLRFVDYLFTRREPWGLITDTRHATEPPTANVRQRLAAYQTANRDLFARYLKADAVVSTTSVDRGAVTAINWMSPPPQPQGFFANMPDALVWAREKLGLSKE